MALKEIFNPILTLHSGLAWKPFFGDAKEEKERSMTNKEILKRLEEIEAQNAAMRETLEWLASIEGCGDGYIVGDPMNEEHAKHCPECQAILAARKVLQSNAGRDFLDCLHKLEAVVKAAREHLHDIDAPVLNEPTIYQYEPGKTRVGGCVRPLPC